MKKKYDVIIVGAGPAGLMLAKQLNKTKLKILLLEKRKTVKKLLNHRYGTFTETTERYQLQKYVLQKYSKFGFYSRGGHSINPFGKNKFCTVDMNLFAKSLVLTCDVRTNYLVNKVERKGNKVIINNEFMAKIVVDCSGNHKVISTLLRINTRDTVNLFSLSYELTGCSIPKERLDEAHFMVDKRWVDGAFWFYPYTIKTAQIGHADFFSKEIPMLPGQGKDLSEYMKKEEPYKSWLKNAKINEILRKPGPTSTLVTFYDDNFLACGDAAGAGTPITGEGLREALEMSTCAYKTILLAFKKEDFTKKTLKAHENFFYERFNKKSYFLSKIIQYIFIRFFTDKELDIFVKNLENLSSEEMYKTLRTEFGYKIAFKVVNLKLIILTSKNFFKKIFGADFSKRKGKGT